MATRYFVSQQHGLRAALVNVPHGNWRWGYRAELRVRPIGDNRPLKGRGCYEGSSIFWDLDTRHMGPRSRTGALLRVLGLVTGE